MSDENFFNHLLEETYRLSEQYHNTDLAHFEETREFLRDNSITFAELKRFKTFVKLIFSEFEIDLPINRLSREHIEDYKNLIGLELNSHFENILIFKCEQRELVVLTTFQQKLLREFLKNKFKKQNPEQGPGVFSQVA